MKVTLDKDVKKLVLGIAREVGCKVDVHRLDRSSLKHLIAQHEAYIENVADKLADTKMFLEDLMEVFEENPGGETTPTTTLH